MLVAIYLEEDWRGARDWKACREQLEARGEVLDLRAFFSDQKPENDLNKVPIFAEAYRPPATLDKILISAFVGPSPPPTRLARINPWLGVHDYGKFPHSANYGQALDLNPWQAFYRSLPQAHLPAKVGTPAQDVLLALSQFDPEWKEVSTALSNPQAYWGINPQKPWDSNFAGLTSILLLAKVANLRAVAHLENGQVDQAEKDYLDSFKFNRPLLNYPLVINCLVAKASCQLNDAILWEGLQRHAWNDVQLKEMEPLWRQTIFWLWGHNLCG